LCDFRQFIKIGAVWYGALFQLQLAPAAGKWKCKFPETRAKKGAAAKTQSDDKARALNWQHTCRGKWGKCGNIWLGSCLN